MVAMTAPAACCGSRRLPCCLVLLLRPAVWAFQMAAPPSAVASQTARAAVNGRSLSVARCSPAGVSVPDPAAAQQQASTQKWAAASMVQLGGVLVTALASVFLATHTAVAATGQLSKAEAKKLAVIEQKLQDEITKSKEADINLPFSDQNLQDFELRAITPTQLKTAMSKIQGLVPYLDELEYLINTRNWDSLKGFLGVFTEQEDQFVALIDGLYSTNRPADKSSREAMQFEAQNIFLALDDLYQGAVSKRVSTAQRAYAKLELAYDRFLKAGNLLARYDPVTSTEPLFKGIPDRLLQYDSDTPPKVQDPVLILRGPDKGRTGRLIGVIKSRGEGVVKLDGAQREVKLMDVRDVVKQLTKDSE